MRFVGRQLRELYRRGFALFLLAPVIVAIAALPELVQHGAEIHLGMFEGIERARALANDPLRWAFGFAKLAGLLVAMLAAARFWGVRAQGHDWWRIGDIAWIRLLVTMALFLFLPTPVDLLRGHGPDALYWTAYTVLSIAVLPLIFSIMGALFGDRRFSLIASIRIGWRWLPLLVLLLVAAYLPVVAAHYGLNYLARGLALPLVWGLMVLDSLVVGLLASVTGAAFALAYEAAFPFSPSAPALSSPPSPPRDRVPAVP